MKNTYTTLLSYFRLKIKYSFGYKGGGLLMQKKKYTGDKPLPANKQKGKKVCTCCKKEKGLVNGFYVSKSPLFSIDGRLPVCKDCIADMCIDSETGEINDVELNKTLRKFDKPYYKNDLMSAYEQFEREHAYIAKEDIKKYGRDIIKLYFKNISMRQCINKSYEDSEKDGFIHQNTNTNKTKTKEIGKIFADVNKSNISNNNELEQSNDKTIKWSKKDKQNMKYVISTIGYDPFDDIGLDDFDKKYCFNILAGYCDTDGIADDGHKMQSVIEMTMLYCQCRRITEQMNIELQKSSVDDVKIQKLTTSKTSLLSSIATIAKDNNIASNYNKNSKQGKSSLSSKMKEMEENDFEAIKVNLFDIKQAEAFKQIADLSNRSIMDQLTFDSSDYSEIVKEQRELIQKYETELDTYKEENRILKNKLIDLENVKKR